MLGQVTLGQAQRPLVQGVIGVAAPLARGQPGDHPVDPLALLGAGELGRNEHNDPFAVPICRDGPPPPATAPDFYGRLAYARG